MKINLPRLILLIGLYFLCHTTPMYAWELNIDIVKGKQTDVCAAYQAYLKVAKSIHALRCERDTLNESSGITKVNWKPLDIDANRGLLGAVLSYNPRSRIEQRLPADKKTDEIIGDLKSNKHFTVRAAKVDIDNDRYADDILRHKKGICADYSTSFFADTIYPVDMTSQANTSSFDPENTTYKEIESKISIDNGKWQSINLFRYQNATYIDKYCTKEAKYHGCEGDDILYVFSIKNGEANEICRYQINIQY